MSFSAREEVKERLEVLRRNGKTLVTITGVFDLLHEGHRDILEQAKKQGDVLIVGLNSDSSTKLLKGVHRPVWDEQKRKEALLSLPFVDYVLIFSEEEIAVPLIDLVIPHVHVNGEEYGKNCVEARRLAEIGARLHLVPRRLDVSTSVLIERMKS